VNHFQRNRKILVERFPGISRKLDQDLPSHAEMVLTSDGQVSMRCGGTWIHSSRAPLQEAEKLIERSIPPGSPFCLFYGFGLAYHLETFIRKHPGTPFAVVEPDIALFNFALSLRDYSQIFLNPAFSLALDASPDAMPALLEGQPYKDIQVFMLRPVVMMHKEYFQSCDKVVHEYLARKEINANTLNKFSRLWVSNICRNLPLMAQYPGVWSLKNKFNNIPALLLAAGPTLLETLPYLHELHERMLIVCVDTALKACLGAGIEPDFLILTDPQYWNSRHLDRSFTLKTVLISDVSTYPSVLKNFSGFGFFCSTPFPLGQYFESRTENKGKLKSGGSVATAAWDFIRQSGINDIYCAGLDLSFPDGETHYRGSTFEERVHGGSHRTAPAETASWLALMGGNPYKTTNLRGEEVLTDQRMKIYIHWFEEQMKAFPEIKTSLLSQRGAALAGMNYFDPEALRSLPVIRKNIDTLIESVKSIKSQASFASLKRALASLMQELDDLIELTSRGMQISESMRNDRVIPERLSDLNKIDQSIMNRESREMAGFILAPVLEDQFKTVKKNLTDSEILENSMSLYTNLNKSLEFHRSLISRIQL